MEHYKETFNLNNLNTKFQLKMAHMNFEQNNLLLLLKQLQNIQEDLELQFITKFYN